MTVKDGFKHERCNYCGKCTTHYKFVEMVRNGETIGVIVCLDHPEESVKSKFGGK